MAENAITVESFQPSTSEAAPVTTTSESPAVVTTAVDNEGAQIPSSDLADAFRSSKEGEPALAEKPTEATIEKPAVAAETKPTVTNTPAEIPAERFEQYAAEQFKGLKPADVTKRLEEFEALQARIQALESDPFSKLDDKEREVLGVYRSGIDPNEYRILQGTDFTKMDPKEVLRQQFKRDNAQAPSHLQDYLFDDEISKKYPNLASGDTEDLSYQADLYRMQTDADKTRQGLIDYQSKHRYQAPTTPTNPPATERKPEESQVDQQAAQRHLDNVAQTIANQKKISFEWKGKDSQAQAVNFEAEDTVPIKGFMEDPGNYLAQYLQREFKSSNGEVDYAKLYRFGALLNNWDNLVRVAYESGGDAREIALRKEKANASPTVTAPVENEPPIRSQLVDAFRQQAAKV